ncbi:hypothetical protein HOG54_02100 [Candidatus Woesearchaeota archaeon]|nr:hypothetical protein [Candidatus Woesearchaeota archaeon]
MVDKSKQGISILGDRALKKHASIEDVEMELSVAKAFRNNGLIQIRIPEYGVPLLVDGTFVLPQKRIRGKTLLGLEDELQITRLVRDLALFHELFSRGNSTPSPVVLYRDAIASNYVVEEASDKMFHIDFSSCNRFVHCLDDLALLLHPSWIKTDESMRKTMLEKYVTLRKIFFREGLTSKGFVDIDSPPAHDIGLMIEGYAKSSDKMERSGVVTNGFDRLFGSVDFDKISPNDYGVFHEFRSARSDYYHKVIWRSK